MNEPEALSAETGGQDTTKISSWFMTFMCMNLPLIGWFFLMYLAFNKKRTGRRNFARAYLFYKLLFLFISLILLFIFIRIAMNILDDTLAYMQML